MSLIAFATFPFVGHLRTTCVLANAMAELGHEVFVMTPEGVDISKYGITQRVIGAGVLPKEFIANFSRSMEGLTGEAAELRAAQELLKLRAMNLDCMPALLSELKPDLLIIDHVAFEASIVARHLRLPFAINGSSINFNRDSGRLPPATSFEPPGLTEEQRKRNLQVYSEKEVKTYPYVIPPINERIRRWGLREIRTRCLDDLYKDKMIEVSPSLKELDFPHGLEIHYTGPWNIEHHERPILHDRSALNNSRPRIYASFGTVVNRQLSLFYVIAEACDVLNLELTIGLGGGLAVEELGTLPGNPTVYSYAPQQQLLAQTDVFVTHGGINSVLEALNLGVPMLCIPVANDQPGTAVRVKYSGVGEYLRPEDFTLTEVTHLLKQLLENGLYKSRALEMAKVIHNSGGVKEAAFLIDKALRKALATNSENKRSHTEELT